jgi:hypothetical protein
MESKLEAKQRMESKLEAKQRMVRDLEAKRDLLQSILKNAPSSMRETEKEQKQAELNVINSQLETLRGSTQ